MISNRILKGIIYTCFRYYKYTVSFRVDCVLRAYKLLHESCLDCAEHIRKFGFRWIWIWLLQILKEALGNNTLFKIGVHNDSTCVTCLETTVVIQLFYLFMKRYTVPGNQIPRLFFLFRHYNDDDDICVRPHIIRHVLVSDKNDEALIYYTFSYKSSHFLEPPYYSLISLTCQLVIQEVSFAIDGHFVS